MKTKDSPAVPEYVTIPQYVEFQRVDGDFILMDLKQGTYFGLDAVASHIWQSLADGNSVTSAVEAATQSFRGAEAGKVDADVRELIGRLLDRNLLIRQSSEKLSGESS